MDVRRIRFPRTNAYLVDTGPHRILVDSGIAGRTRPISDAVDDTGNQPDLLLLTHTHHDHAGNAANVQERYDARICVHAAGAEALARGYSAFPAGATGLGRFAAGVAGAFGARGSTLQTCEPGIVLGRPDDAETETTPRSFDLHEHGFPGVAVHVPSHSRDSLAFIADDGSCFCGDVLFNLVPWSLMPPFADSPERLHLHWRVLLGFGGRYFYPGHGSPFDRERLEPFVERLAERF